MSDDWPVKVHPLAKGDIARLKAEHPQAYAAMIAGLQALAKEKDPRKPTNKKLSVINSYPYAVGCLRIKAWGQNWRVVLRIVEADADGWIIQVDLNEVELKRNGRWLQVVFADIRNAKTYDFGLRVRWERVKAG